MTEVFYRMMKVRNLKEMELWMERVPESIKKVAKKERQMLDCERAARHQEELVRLSLE